MAEINPQDTTGPSLLEDLRKDVEEAQNLRQSARLYTHGQTNFEYEKPEIERVAAEHKVPGFLEDKSESISSDLEPEVLCLSVCLSLSLSLCVCVCVCVCMCVYACVCVCVWVWVGGWGCVHVCTCVYVFPRIHLQ